MKPARQPEVLVPWKVRPEHRTSYELTMLRLEERRRSGGKLPRDESTRLTNWMRLLKDQGLVITYDPGAGFVLVKAREGDQGIIRP